MWGKVFLCALSFVCVACSMESGYEMMRQKAYRDCVEQSSHPARDCELPPDSDLYQQELEKRALDTPPK